jgi:hypothetical protein
MSKPEYVIRGAKNARIQVWTFVSPNNQGSMKSLGIHELQMHSVDTYDTVKRGCSSLELMVRPHKVVTICERTFVVEGLPDPHYVRSCLTPEDADGNITVPYGFALVTCQTCGRPFKAFEDNTNRRNW